MPMPTSRVNLCGAPAGGGRRVFGRRQRSCGVPSARALSRTSARITRERFRLHLQRFEECLVGGGGPQEAAFLPTLGAEDLNLADVPKGKAPPKRDHGCGPVRKLG